MSLFSITWNLRIVVRVLDYFFRGSEFKTTRLFQSLILLGSIKWVPRTSGDLGKNIFAFLFSAHNTISLSCHEQVCLMRLCFERYFSHLWPDDGRSVSRNVALLNILVHDIINLLYSEDLLLKSNLSPCSGFAVLTQLNPTNKKGARKFLIKMSSWKYVIFIRL